MRGVPAYRFFGILGSPETPRTLLVHLGSGSHPVWQGKEGGAMRW